MSKKLSKETIKFLEKLGFEEEEGWGYTLKLKNLTNNEYDFSIEDDNDLKKMLYSIYEAGLINGMNRVRKPIIEALNL